MKRISCLLLAVSSLVSCGVGEVSSDGREDQQLAQNQRKDESPPPSTPPPGDPGSGICIEACGTPDAGTMTPPPSNNPCPSGQTPVYRYVADSQTNSTGERLTAGPGGAPMTMTCEATTCTGTDVEVVEKGGELDPSTGQMTMGDTDLCVPPPPTCANGEFATYVPPTPDYGGKDGMRDGTGGNGSGMTTGQWICTGGCDVLIQYGGLFGMRLVCAPPPPTSCPADQEPQFDVTTETWGCEPACNGGTYDPAQYLGAAVCVPC